MRLKLSTVGPIKENGGRFLTGHDVE